MVLHTRSVQVAASTDRVYMLLSDLDKLPEYFPPVTAVRAGSGRAVVVTAGESAQSVAAEVELDRDGPGTRIEWVVRGTPYTGIVIVQDGPSDVDSIVTVMVDDGRDPDDYGAVERERVHDAGQFGGSEGREALPVDALTRHREAGTDADLAVGDILERGLDHLRAYVASGGGRQG
ncbi:MULTISPECIES: SRPBCC family protein [unclassified Embleya]|uniref:SRPBCC family protein n=1 Tax=unclassified Embleya TaxID=2699296 RepID=UPI0036C2D28D